MADLFCDFLYFQSLATNYNLPLFLPPKQYFSSSLHSHNSRFSKIPRRSPHLQLLHKPSPFALSASDIDLISIHEHSDGSYLFRFGDPSEVEKNVEVEESKIIKEEEIEGDDTDVSSMVQVMEGEDDTEGTASVLTEASDRGDSIFSSSNTLIAVEGDSESSEKLLAIPVDVEVPVLTSNEEMGGISSQDLDIEQIENWEGLNEEYEYSNPVEASIPDESLQIGSNAVEVFYEESLEETSNVTCTSKEMDINAIPSIDIEQQAVNVEESLNKKDVYPPADTSILDQSSEVVDNITTVALLEKESDDISSADIDANQIGGMEDDLDGDYEESLVDASVLDESSEVENGISAVVLLENETDDGNTSTSDIAIEPTGNVEERINEEYEESLVYTSVLDKRAEVLDNTKAALSEKEATDVTSAPCEDSHVDAIVLDKSSEIEIGISPVVLLEEETDSTRDIEIEPIGNVEDGKNEEYEDSPADVSVLDKSSEVENEMSAVVLMENETDDGNTSASDIDIQQTENVEERINEESEESLVDTSVLDKRAEVLNNTKAALSEKEAADITSVPYEDSLVDAFVLDKSSKVEYGISAVVEEETDENTSTRDIEIERTGNMEEGKNEEYEDSPLDKRSEVLINDVAASSEKEAADVAYASDIDIEDTGNVEQGLDKVHEQPSSVDASRPDQRPEVENFITAQEVLEKETADATTPVALKTDPVVSALDIDAGQDGLETVVTTNVVPISELHNAETGIHDEKIGDNNRESFDDNLVSPSSDSEPAMSLYEETEVLNIQTEMQNLATEESSETDVDNIKAVEMPNVLSNDNESDMYGAEDDTPSTEPAMAWTLGSEEQTSGSGSGMPNETVGYESEKDVIHLLTSSQLEADSVLEEETGTETVEEPRTDDGSENQTVGGNLAEASVHEVTAPESTMTSQEILVTDFVLSSGAALLPHPSKVLTGGEDAYFIADQTWLGVADGVGQWSLDGTAPGGYAQEFIKNCEKIISDCSGNLINNPLELLNLSVAQTHSPGSSTVLIAHFDGQALHVANVGDSGFIILRHGAVYKRSSPMHHVFSLPVRIGRGDDPSSLLQLYKVDLEEDDIIVTATDGLLNNLYNQEILLIAMKSLADDKTPEEIAELLAKRAQEVGSSASARSPFADEAQAAGFPAYSGGMLDDVAVIVSVVRRR